VRPSRGCAYLRQRVARLVDDARGEGVLGKGVVLAMVLTAGVAAMKTVGNANQNKSQELGGHIGGLARGGRSP
jgi:hypothetical protein